jgi:hypothetical protein
MTTCQDPDSEYYGLPCQCVDCRPENICVDPNGCVECDGPVHECAPADEGAA